MDLMQFKKINDCITALDSDSTFSVKMFDSGAYFQITNSNGQIHDIGFVALRDAFQILKNNYQEVSHYIEWCNQNPDSVDNRVFEKEKINFDDIIDELKNNKILPLIADHWAYIEKPLRVISDHYFPNSRIFVVGKEQTKLLFNAISRLIYCTNNISTIDVIFDSQCPFSLKNIERTLDVLNEIICFYDVSTRALPASNVSLVIINDSIIRNFIYKVLRFIEEEKKLSVFLDRLTENTSNNDLLSIKTENYNLTSIFKKSDTQLSEADLSSGDILRFFKEPFIEKGYYYLTTQWTNNDGSSLDLQSFIAVFSELYPSYSIIESDNEFTLLRKKDFLTAACGGENIIYYGAPGTGKSHTIDDEIDEKNSVRTVFHADTTNSDFMGCLKPKMNGTAIEYDFRPGPFTISVCNAIKDPEHHHWLIIEEINRAPAAAVFGEIFQLLDRESGTCASRYSITLSDLDMKSYIEGEIGNGLEQAKLKLPSNLTLLATMNSSDQAVMPLDTAFKRRWQFRYIPLDFNVAYKSKGKPCAVGDLKISDQAGIDIEVSWKSFATTINTILTEQDIPEDRHLGPFFLSESEMKDNPKEALTGKLFMYLWDDVLRHGMKDTVFDSSIRTYGQLTRLYDDNEKIFSDQFYDVLEENNSKADVLLKAVAEEQPEYNLGD